MKYTKSIGIPSSKNLSMAVGKLLYHISLNSGFKVVMISSPFHRCCYIWKFVSSKFWQFKNQWPAFPNPGWFKVKQIVNANCQHISRYMVLILPSQESCVLVNQMAILLPRHILWVSGIPREGVGEKFFSLFLNLTDTLPLKIQGFDKILNKMSCVALHRNCITS